MPIKPPLESNSPNRLRNGSAAGAALVALLTTFEGVRLNAYPDPATKGPPWTICMGETQGVHKGMTKTLAECKADLARRVPDYARPIALCAKVPLPDKRYIALVSLAWNIGPGKVCSGSVMQKLNAGDVRGGCDAFLKYNRAAGIVFPGLTRRRVKERALCLEPVSAENPQS
jgi:lysozyme